MTTPYGFNPNQSGATSSPQQFRPVGQNLPPQAQLQQMNPSPMAGASYGNIPLNQGIPRPNQPVQTRPNQAIPKQGPQQNLNQPTLGQLPQQTFVHSNIPGQPSQLQPRQAIPTQAPQQLLPHQNPAQPQFPQNPAQPQFPQNPAQSQFPQNLAHSQFPQNPAQSQFPQNPAQPQFPQNPAQPQFPQNPAQPQFPQNQPISQTRPGQPQFPVQAGPTKQPLPGQPSQHLPGTGMQPQPFSGQQAQQFPFQQANQQQHPNQPSQNPALAQQSPNSFSTFPPQQLGQHQPFPTGQIPRGSPASLSPTGRFISPMQQGPTQIRGILPGQNVPPQQPLQSRGPGVQGVQNVQGIQGVQNVQGIQNVQGVQAPIQRTTAQPGITGSTVSSPGTPPLATTPLMPPSGPNVDPQAASYSQAQQIPGLNNALNPTMPPQPGPFGFGQQQPLTAEQLREQQRKQVLLGQAPVRQLGAPVGPQGQNYVPRQAGQTNTSFQPPPASKPQKIDPTQIPTPSSTLDQSKVVQYNTRVPANPPAANSQFLVIDDGNCSPRIMRSSLYNIPCSSDLAKQAGIPFNIVVTPLAEPGPNENPVSVVDMGTLGPLRCKRCGAYMNCFNIFIDGGRQYRCCLCTFINEVPQEYFSPLDPRGFRHDIYMRAELSHGSVEYVATADYVLRPPEAMHYLFVLDVSNPAVTSGFVATFVRSLRQILNNLPSHLEDVKFGLMTFDTSIHFYNLNASLQKPRMLVVPDIENVYLPIARDGNLLVSYKTSKELVNKLLDQLPAMFAQTKATRSAFGSALQAAYLLLKPHGGKIIAFQSSLPVLGLGILNNRLDQKIVGTDKEKTLYQSQNQFYGRFAEQAAQVKISVDLFLLSGSYVDAATLGSLCKFTGGQLYYYPGGFSNDRDQEKLHFDLSHNLNRTTGYEAVMRVRCSNGLQVEEYQGNCLTTLTDIELAGIDSDKTFSIRLKHDDKLDEKAEAYIQCALLYTTANGYRRIRVHTLGLSCTNNLSTIFRGADLDTIMNVFTRNAVEEAHNSSLAQVRSSLIEKCINLLYVYRKNCATTTSPAQLILPEGLKLVPVYTLALLKNILFRNGTDVNIDERIGYMQAAVSSFNVGQLSSFIYPRMFALHKILLEEGERADTVRLTAESLDPQGIYFLENGQRIIFWIGGQTSNEVFSQLFQIIPASSHHDSQQIKLLPAESNQTIARVHEIIKGIQQDRKTYLRLEIVRQRESQESKFLGYLIEDQQFDTSNYIEFLCTIHRNIQQKLS